MNSRAARVENIVTALREREGVRGRQVEGTHRHRFLIVCPIAFCPRLSFPKSWSPQSLHPPSPQLLKPKTWELSFAFWCWERPPSEACPTPARLHESGLGPGTSSQRLEGPSQPVLDGRPRLGLSFPVLGSMCTSLFRLTVCCVAPAHPPLLYLSLARRDEDPCTAVRNEVCAAMAVDWSRAMGHRHFARDPVSCALPLFLL